MAVISLPTLTILFFFFYKERFLQICELLVNSSSNGNVCRESSITVNDNDVKHKDVDKKEM